MNLSSSASPPPLPGQKQALSPERTLRRLFLTLFLRGRTSRSLKKQSAPKSVGSKLFLTLLFYALFGLVALAFLQQPVFVLSVYLHATTFIFVGMFVAASAGEVLFNKEEADILLHRPVAPRTMLWAKIGVLVQVSLWLAGAFNLAGFFSGIPDGGVLFPVVHVFSICLETLFCTGCIVLMYQLCLRWFGRERLEALMTTAQVFAAAGFVLLGQLGPHLISRFGNTLRVASESWWIYAVPPAWFAGVNDFAVGSRSASSAVLAALALASTGIVLWLAFGKLARDYEIGLQTLGERVSRRPAPQGKGRWSTRLVNAAPLRWWLRNPVTRASFLLTLAYLVRDRDVKLRVYPSLAPMLVIPAMFLFRSGGDDATFGIAFAGGYLGIIPLLAVSLMQHSQQWQAADVFRAAPLAGPAPLCDGVRRAVLCVLTLPIVVLFAAAAWVVETEPQRLMVMLPGLLAVPIYAIIPCLGGKGVPLSLPTEEGKSASRGLNMIAAMLLAVLLSGAAMLSWSQGWFARLLIAEGAVVALVYTLLRRRARKARWSSIE